MTYSYECVKCGLIEERVSSVKDMVREITCNGCGGRSVKQIEAPALVGVSSTRNKRNKEMTRRNEEAGKRMRWSHKSFRAADAST